MIIEWLTDRAEQIAVSRPEKDAWSELNLSTRKAKIVSRFVQLWSEKHSRGAAVQLASAERMDWPLPSGDVDSGMLTERILAWLDRRDELAMTTY